MAHKTKNTENENIANFSCDVSPENAMDELLQKEKDLMEQEQNKPFDIATMLFHTEQDLTEIINKSVCLQDSIQQQLAMYEDESMDDNHTDKGTVSFGYFLLMKELIDHIRKVQSTVLQCRLNAS